MKQPKELKIAIADDHNLFRSGLINLIHSFGKNYNVILEASNGRELLQKIEDGLKPDIILLDLSMPLMDGYSVSKILHKRYPELKVIVLTMIDDEASMIRMLKSGVHGYLSKDVEPVELKKALDVTMEKGFYYTEIMSGILIDTVTPDVPSVLLLSGREHEFLELACSENTYKEIAEKMCVSAKTVEGYRMSVFGKLQLRSRVGLVLFAVRNKLIKMQ